MDQETSLAWWKKAAEQRIEAMNAKIPKQIIKEIPATTKSIKPCTLATPIIIIISPSILQNSKRKYKTLKWVL